MSFDSLSLALEYLDRHLYQRYIFPIAAGKKFPPCVRDNLDGNASNDPEQITRWAKKWPGCNWGVAHKKSKLLVIDVDCNQTKGKVGQQTFDALALAYDFPDTEKTTTPSGGFHLVYRGEHIMALGENGLGRDIDSPNYTLIPGCTFTDGTSYVGNGADAVACPEWVYTVIKNSKARARLGVAAGEVVVELDQQGNIDAAIDYLQNDAEPAVQGQNGDIKTLKAALYLKDLGISQEMGAQLLNEYYNPRCTPPWDFDDLAKKMESAYAYGSLSKVGGKTAEADFGDDPPPPITPMGSRRKIEAERQARAAAREREAAIPPDQRARRMRRGDILKEWVWISGIERFVEVANPRTMWRRSGFDAHFRQFSKTKAFSDELFKETGGLRKFNAMAYKPGEPEIIDGTTFNLYRPSGVVPAEGDLSWWNDHLAYLFPDDASRNHVLNWMAWLVQNMEKKPKHALLIQGEDQGTGKSFLSEMLSRIVGMRNVTNLNQSDLHGDFNGWAAYSKLLVIEELRAVDKTEVANKLHPLITQDRISVNEKGIARQDMDNCFGIFAMTNNEAALNLDPKDRRYLVVSTSAEPRYGKGSDRSTEYYRALYARLSDPAAVAAVMYALMNRDLGLYDGAAAAPSTGAKTKMIDAGASDLEHFMIEHAGEWPLSGRVISAEDVIATLPRRLEGRTNRLTVTIHGVLRRRFQGVELGQCQLSDGKRPRLIAINGAGGILANLRKIELGALYERDRKNAGEGKMLDDEDASADFAEPSED